MSTMFDGVAAGVRLRHTHPGPLEPPEPGLRLSVIIATYNRRSLLADVLRALDRQTIPRELYEVIVIDDGSTDGTAAWLAARPADPRRCFVSQPNQGVSAARNAGIRMARGDILVFLDDDFIPAPSLLEEHLKIHESERAVAVIGPAPSLRRYVQPWIAWQQAAMERVYREMADGSLEPSFREFWTGNCSLPRSDAAALGGFDPSLRMYQDVELGYRLMCRGVRFRFCPGATGVHHNAHSFETWCCTQGEYGEFSVQLLRRLGEDSLLDLLARDWAGRCGLTRWLVRTTAGFPRRVALATTVLKAGIRTATFWPMSRFSYAVCSALANMLYWDRVIREWEGGKSLWRLLESRVQVGPPS
jgi:glycosyltransferase involved in cell wall biosynthesis